MLLYVLWCGLCNGNISFAQCCIRLYHQQVSVDVHTVETGDFKPRDSHLLQSWDSSQFYSSRITISFCVWANFLKLLKRLLTSSYLSFWPSFRPIGTDHVPLDGFSWNLTFGLFFQNQLRKFNFHKNLAKITGTLHEDLLTFMIMSEFFVE
jgi:hypothetical protein